MSVLFICLFVHKTFFRYRYFKVVEAKFSEIGENTSGLSKPGRIMICTRRNSSELKFETVIINGKCFRIKVMNSESRECETFDAKTSLVLQVTDELAQYTDATASGYTENLTAIIKYSIRGREKTMEIKQSPPVEESSTPLRFRLAFN